MAERFGGGAAEEAVALCASRGTAGVGVCGGGGRVAGEVVGAVEEDLFGEEDGVFDMPEEGDGCVAFGVEGWGGGHDLRGGGAC